MSYSFDIWKLQREKEVVPEEKNDQTKGAEDWCLTGKGTAAIEDQRKPKIQTCRNTNMKGNQK